MSGHEASHQLGDPPTKMHHGALAVRDRDGGAVHLCVAVMHCWEISLA